MITVQYYYSSTPGLYKFTEPNFIGGVVQLESRGLGTAAKYFTHKSNVKDKTS